LFPAGFLLAFARPRPSIRRLLLGFAFVLALGGTIGVWFGGGVEALRDWPHTFSPVMRELEPAPSNQSVNGVLRRMAQGGTYPTRSLPDLSIGSTVVRSTLSPNAAGVAARVTALAIVVVSLLVTLRPPRGVPLAIDAGLRLSTLVATALMVTPFVWDHYYVLLLINGLVLLRVVPAGTASWWIFIAGAHVVGLHRYWRVFVELGGHTALSLGLIGTALCWIASVVALVKSESWRPSFAEAAVNSRVPPECGRQDLERRVVRAVGVADQGSSGQGCFG
jgi:hypothetical protein